MNLNFKTEWIDLAGRMKIGKHKGKMIDTVARDDPGYLEWILENVEDISSDDQRCIESSLRLKR